MRGLLIIPIATILVAGSLAAREHHGSMRAPGTDERRALPQQYPHYAYDGSWTFVRIRTNSDYGGFRRGGGWAHDYPDADINFSKILGELTRVKTRTLPSGGNVLTFDDPRLYQYPFAYVSEPDEWTVTPGEAQGLREYLLRGGFVIFDDFFEYEMENLVRQMQRVFPELQFQLIDGSHRLWDSFFELDPLQIVLTGPRKNGTPKFWGLFEENDPVKRLLAVAGAGGDIGDLWEWSASGFYPVDPTNEAYKIGINYVIYALTH